MESFQVRTYGPSTCRAAVLHGGPGAIGSAAGLARGLAESCGVLEPLQSKYSVTEQVEELHRQLTAYASRPLVLIGHSWGAWLAALYAARHPGLAARLVLIGCGPLEAAYLPQLEARRLAHFTPEEAARYRELLAALSSPGSAPDALLRQLGTLCEKADNFQPFEEPDGDSGTIDGEMYDKVFGEAAELRRDGRLLAAFDRISCPLEIIHGVYDTHPPEGVTEPLARRGIPYTFHLLEQCGHTPWRERYARDEFFRLLNDAVKKEAR